MKLDHDEVMLFVPTANYAGLSREAKEALRMYSTREGWCARGGTCFVVGESRLDELAGLTFKSGGFLLL